jgi:hypothetical protein
MGMWGGLIRVEARKAVAFLKKSSAKNFCPMRERQFGCRGKVVDGGWTNGTNEQKFFAELFFKKATAFFCFNPFD